MSIMNTLVFKVLFLIMCVCTSTFVYENEYRACRGPRAGAIGGYKSHEVGTGN